MSTIVTETSHYHIACFRASRPTALQSGWESSDYKLLYVDIRNMTKC